MRESAPDDPDDAGEEPLANTVKRVAQVTVDIPTAVAKDGARKSGSPPRQVSRQWRALVPTSLRLLR